MKWEKYSLMTREHREEYDYRFKRDKIELPFNFIFFFAIKAIVISDMILVGSLYLVPQLADLKQYASPLMELVWTMNVVIVYILIAELIVYIIASIVYETKKYRWLKQRGYN